MRYKSQKAAMLWLFFLGLFGAHRFYVGKIWTGLLYMSTFGFLGIGVLIDFIRIALYSFKDKQGRDLKADCPLALTVIFGCYLLTLTTVVCVGIFTPVETIEVNKIYITEKNITAQIQNDTKNNKYIIEDGDIFWVIDKTGNKYKIETNGQIMSINGDTAIKELDRAVKVEEYVDDKTLLNKDITEVEVQGKLYKIEYFNGLGYITKDSIKIHNLTMNNSLGKEFNIISKLSNSDIADWYIVDLGDGRYSYISLKDITMDKEEIDKMLAEKKRKKEEEYKALVGMQEEKREYDVKTVDGIVYMTANTVVDMYDNDRDILNTYSGKKVCITGKVKNIIYGEIVEKKGRNSIIWPSVHLDNDEMSSWFGIGLEIKDLRFNEFAMRNNIDTNSVLRAYGIGNSGTTFGLSECNYIELLNNGVVVSTWESSDEEYVAQKNSGKEPIKVTAKELLILAENENFDNVPYNASTEEIYNKYNLEKVTVTGKVEDINNGYVYLDCNNGGYNFVGADTSLVVYCKVKDKNKYTKGQTVSITGVAKCYTYAVVIEEQ